MSIPLDDLYHWVDSLLPDPIVLYVFRPHGSKKISDCKWLKEYDFKPNLSESEYNWLKKYKGTYELPSIVLHDQEPLDWNYYQQQSLECNFYNQPAAEINLDQLTPQQLEFEKIKHKYIADFNLKFPIFTLTSLLYDRSILIHSEKNSDDLLQYQNIGFIGVHYWAHAVIARDWYRFAEFDSRLHPAKTLPQHKFLIYCRDWSSGREYRLKFLELLVKNNLNQDSQTSVMHANSEDVHFSQHQFKNPDFELTFPELINQIPLNEYSSSASASYNYFDFVNTDVSVVLETVFDSNKIHLTEKTLRPIACGHPFILAAGPGSLEYVKSYGFKTFAPWIDESYDQETNGAKRLEKIIKSMKQIQNLQGQELVNFSRAVKQIADFNKKHFFGNEFFNQVRDELKNNLDLARGQVYKTQGKHHLELLKLLKIRKLVHHVPFRREKTQMLRQLRRSCQDDQSSPPQDLFV
jgi:hypothetical protein